MSGSDWTAIAIVALAAVWFSWRIWRRWRGKGKGGCDNCPK